MADHRPYLESAYLARVISGNTYQSLRGVGKHIAKHLPKAMEAGALKAEAMARRPVVPSSARNASKPAAPSAGPRNRCICGSSSMTRMRGL